jgi:hypothetical protein
LCVIAPVPYANTAESEEDERAETAESGTSWAAFERQDVQGIAHRACSGVLDEIGTLAGDSEKSCGAKFELAGSNFAPQSTQPQFGIGHRFMKYRTTK